MLDDILLQVSKPARYIGQEWNMPKKDFEKCEIRFALCFPGLYEIGMSNFGVRILYELLNNLPEVTCERVFHPAADLESLMRKNSLEIFSLESQRKLTDFDMVGFSLGYELNYTNILNILDLGGIPLLSSLRPDNLPIIIAGGSCCLNPEPLADFIDLFVIGEAEEVIVEIVELYRSKKKIAGGKKPNKKDILYELTQIEGVYVPAFYSVEYNPDGTLKSFIPKSRSIAKKIKKRIIKDLNKTNYPINWIVPNVEIIHDRITLELMRGCPNRCRFCQARSLYFPYRCIEPSRIINLAKEVYKLTGYEDISLLGLSVGDYYKIKEVLTDLIDIFRKDAVSISLPSLKPRDNTKDLLALITRVRKTGLTLAPEVATERLRRVINKDYNRNIFFNTVEAAYKLGYKHIKLYFMIGLPSETKEDLDGILDLSRAVSELKTKVDKKSARVNISVASLIPKPHTPFQWLAMENLESIENKQNYLKSKIKKCVQEKSKIKISFHNRYMSFIEGILSRGDRRISQVILKTWKKGAKFDAWENYFLFEPWIKSFREINLDPNFYLTRKRSIEEHLPWDFIDTGISKEDLASELKQVNL